MHEIVTCANKLLSNNIVTRAHKIVTRIDEIHFVCTCFYLVFTKYSNNSFAHELLSYNIVTRAHEIVTQNTNLCVQNANFCQQLSCVHKRIARTHKIVTSAHT